FGDDVDQQDAASECSNGIVWCRRADGRLIATAMHVTPTGSIERHRWTRRQTRRAARRCAMGRRRWPWLPAEELRQAPPRAAGRQTAACGLGAATPESVRQRRQARGRQGWTTPRLLRLERRLPAAAQV